MNRIEATAIAGLMLLGPRSEPLIAPPVQATWTADSKPIFDVGAESEDTLDTFGEVMGVARMPSGEVVVADRKASALRYFSATGQYRRAVGRHGEGPGEFSQSILRLLHCGDSLFVMEWNFRLQVFSQNGVFARTMMLAPPRPGESPYNIACNPAGLLLSYGWEKNGDAKPGTFRPAVPFWIANPDGAIHSQLGYHPGSERFGNMVDGVLRGSGPLPLGKQPVVAIGRNHAYIGTADSFAIEVYGLDGRRTGTIVRPGFDLRTTRADIEHFLMVDTAGKSAESKAAAMKRYAAGVTYPKTIPAYSAFVIDSDDNLWVERYPRAAELAAHWLVFSPTGVEMAHVDLPSNFNVAEIGRDYVLGVSIELPDGVHHVKEFRLHRAATH
jgi:hypothetical protein